MFLWYIIGSMAAVISQWWIHLDLWSDASVTTYVWPDRGLHESSYVPPMLSAIPTTKKIIPTKTMYLRLEALIALERMGDHLYSDLALPLVIISAYRPHSHQRAIIQQLGDGNLRAKPWHSEHQLWLAIDVMWLTNAHMASDTDASRIYQWLAANAHTYGRHQSYQKWLTIDGYHQEKRHRRYLGEPLATLLHQEQITLTEYFYNSIRRIDDHGDAIDNFPHLFTSRVVQPPKTSSRPTRRTPRTSRPTPPPATSTPSIDDTIEQQLFDRPL